MDSKLQLTVIIAVVCLLGLVLELVRRRRLMERYALLWVFAAVVLLAMAIWSDLLAEFASAIGVKVPSNALFAVAFVFVLLLLIHFSLVISKLTDEVKILAQRLAQLDTESKLTSLQDGRKPPEEAGDQDPPRVSAGRG